MDLETHSVNSNGRIEQEEALYDMVAQTLINVIGQKLEKKYGIERLKVLGATEFSGTTRSEEAEKWPRTLQKCFCVMQCPEEKKVDLVVFFLQEEAKEGEKGSVEKKKAKTIVSQGLC